MILAERVKQKLQQKKTAILVIIRSSRHLDTAKNKFVWSRLRFSDI